MRQRLIAFVLSFAFGLVPVAAMAADAFVQENHTPIVSKPGVGGKVLRWVDSGFPLTVVARKGEWLQVDAGRLKPATGEAWIPASRVGPVPPGAAGPALAAEGADADFRLDVGGVPDVAFRARCFILDDGRSRLVVLRDATPAAYQIVGDAVSCRVSNLGNNGYLQTMLSSADGRPIASAPAVISDRSATLRSDGPWGVAGNFDEPLRFALFRNMPDGDDVEPLPPIVSPAPPSGNMVPPIGNPVPAIGNPVPAMGNPVPAMANPVPAFGNSPVPPFRGSSRAAFRSSPVVMPFRPMQ